MLGSISNARAQIQAANSERVSKLRKSGFYVVAPRVHHGDYNADNYDFKTCSTYLELQAIKQSLGFQGALDYEFLNPIGC